MQNLSTPRHLLRMARLLTAIAILVATAGPAFSQSQAAQKAKKYVATKEIVFDKATGKLRKPTVEETQALVDQISTLTNRSTEGLSLQQHQNGMKSMSLAGRFGGVILGRANEDGTTEVRCVMTMEEAVDFLGLEEDTTPQQ
jgi:hypothetical protein